MNTSHRLWAAHNKQFRDPLEIVGQWNSTQTVDPKLLKFSVKGSFFKILDQCKIRLLISREYEHLMICCGAAKGGADISFLSLPHPSGIAVDRKKRSVYIASTRNPNQIFSFVPMQGLINRDDLKSKQILKKIPKNTLIPKNSMYYPGSLYIHDLALIDGDLYANAVGHNAVVQLLTTGGYKYVWWPLCVEKNKKLQSKANYLQLNSIAAGRSIKESYFSASTSRILSSRPGQIHFPVDGHGVIFFGKTRMPICYGLTRPHSARLYKNTLWVENSGYGEFGFVHKNHFHSIVKLPGWTRGLTIHKDIAFVGVSRVIPKFTRYAPGLDVKKSRCGIFAVNIKTGKILGSIEWPFGNQVFSIEWLPKDFTSGFPNFHYPKKSSTHIRDLFYAFQAT